MPPAWYQWKGDDLLLNIRVRPNSKITQICAPQENCLLIRISATPVDGKANTCLIKFLADIFQVSKSRVSLLKGSTSRQKRVLVRTPRHLPDIISLESTLHYKK